MHHLKSVAVMALVSFITIAAANRIGALRSALRTDT